jgi:hypothetical protein
MFDPFAEKVFDAHIAALLRARPKLLLSSPAPHMSQRRTPLSVSDKKLDSALAEINGLRALRETLRKK